MSSALYNCPGSGFPSHDIVTIHGVRVLQVRFALCPRRTVPVSLASGWWVIVIIVFTSRRVPGVGEREVEVNLPPGGQREEGEEDQRDQAHHPGTGVRRE